MNDWPTDIESGGTARCLAQPRWNEFTIYSTIYYTKPEDVGKQNAVYKIDFDNKTAGLGCSLWMDVEHDHLQEGYRYSIVRHNEGWEAYYTIIFGT